MTPEQKSALEALAGTLHIHFPVSVIVVLDEIPEDGEEVQAGLVFRGNRDVLIKLLEGAIERVDREADKIKSMYSS